MTLSWLFPGLVIGTLLALVAVGLALTFSLLRFVNFAHGDLVSVGAYLTYIFSHDLQWPLPAASMASVILTGTLAVIIERVAFRPLASSKISMFVSSFGVSLILNAAITLIFGSVTLALVSETSRLHIGNLTVMVPEAIALASSPLMLIIVAGISRRTIAGLAARGIAENRELVDLAGISSNRVVAKAFFLSGAMAAVAGTLFGALYGISSEMGYRYGLWSFLVIILAGFGKIHGIAVASLMTGVAIAVTMYYTSSYTAVQAVVFALMASTLLFRPRGLFGTKLREV